MTPPKTAIASAFGTRQINSSTRMKTAISTHVITCPQI